ncbi:MAG: ArsA family ATPase [Microcoleaceae cyanobacterium]
MALILTFLGKGGTDQTTIAVASAKALAQQGRRVLLASQDASPGFSLILGSEVEGKPTEVAQNLDALQFKATQLLEESWEEIKTLESQYLRTPFFKNVYGQELGVFPGMDTALALNAIRQYDAQGKYDVIVYDGGAGPDVLRMLGMPETLSWYVRRFRQVFLESDFWRSISPFVQPIASAVLNVDVSSDNFAQPTNQVNNLLDQGREAVADSSRVLAYLVTEGNEISVATAHYLWGSAQQVGLTVGGVLLSQSSSDRVTSSAGLSERFEPLAIYPVPQRSGEDWQALIGALPDFSQPVTVPKPIEIDQAQRQVSLFLPGFDKKQIKLTQYGPEVTIEAGDQRRNILLPDSLRGKPVTGAKFQKNYLTISF